MSLVSDEAEDFPSGECGHLIGHLAIPNKDGVLAYLPIRCNMSEGHLAPWSPHRFRDPMSGMQVNKTMFPATTIVDERGCVVEA